MTRTAGRVCALSVLLFLVAMTGAGADAGTPTVDRFGWRIERDIRRFRFAGAPALFDLLAIRPGMTILDLGTGTGQFAFEFSRRLNGKGTVYATDTQPRCIDHVKKEAERRGLADVHAVLVGKEGLDAFYGEHAYDLITIFHVSLGYDKKVDLLRGLRGRLAEGGRLVLILQKTATPFSAGDFAGDVRDLARELSREPADSPFSGVLKDTTRKLLGERSGADSPEERVRDAVVEDFNEALHSESRFYNRFVEGSVIRPDVGFTPGERAFADFLVLSYGRWMSVYGDVSHPDFDTPDAAGTRSDFPPTHTAANKADGLFLNKLLFVQKFRKYLKADRMFASGFTSPIRAAFEEAGYTVDRVYPAVIPFEDVVVFSAR